jgi:hypothetical protein
MPANADPMAEYLTYLADVRGGAVGDMGFTLEDFKRYIAGLRKHPRGINQSASASGNLRWRCRRSRPRGDGGGPPVRAHYEAASPRVQALQPCSRHRRAASWAKGGSRGLCRSGSRPLPTFVLGLPVRDQISASELLFNALRQADDPSEIVKVSKNQTLFLSIEETSC